jgi:hypothetical protein
MFRKILSAYRSLAFCLPLLRRSSRKKVFRIGYRVGGDVARESARFEAIRLVLREFGYIEGQNIAGRIPICGGQAQSIP